LNVAVAPGGNPVTLGVMLPLVTPFNGVVLMEYVAVWPGAMFWTRETTAPLQSARVEFTVMGAVAVCVMLPLFPVNVTL
jgi:hypothetical protein